MPTQLVYRPTLRVYRIASGFLLALLLLSVGVVPLARAQGQDPRFFAETGYRVDSEVFWTYLQQRGGVRTFGLPVSQAFLFLGCRVQLFQRLVLQQCGSGPVGLLNLLDENLLPYTRINGSTLPPSEPSLVRQAPTPSDPAYASRVAEFVGQTIPDTFDGEPVRFLQTFQTTVSLAEAYPLGDGNAGLLPLLNLEIWGLPTSRPMRDPTNRNFIYQRFQRGIMQYDKGCGCTRGLLLGDYLKAILTGQNLPADLAAQSQNSRLYRQFAPGRPVSLARPSELPATDLSAAFTRQQPTETPALPASKAARSVVLGYYVPYDPTSWAALQTHPDSVQYVAAQWASIDACGNIGSRDDQTLKQFASSHGIRVLPSLLTSSASLNHRLLTETDVSAHAIEQIVQYTVDEGYAGFDLDLEGVNADDREALSAFVARLAEALHARQKLLTLAIPPKQSDVTTGWAGAYDYATLGAQADLVTIMAYEYHGPWSAPGSIAPFPSVQRVLAFATSQMDSRKVLLGLAFYGYDWNLTDGGARAIGYAQAEVIAEQYGAAMTLDPATQSATFSYQANGGAAPAGPPPPPPLRNIVTVREQPPCAATPPPPTSTPPTPTPRPQSAIQSHEVWLEEATSAAARLDLARLYQAGGIATWRLGLEDPSVWPLLETFRASPP